MAEATQNGENLVKLSQKMVGKLRNFLKKVGDGLTTVPYVPGALFEMAKLRKEEKKKAKEELEKVVNSAKKAKQESKKESVKTEEIKKVPAEPVENQMPAEPVIPIGVFGKRVDEAVKQQMEDDEKAKAANNSSFVEGYEEAAQRRTEDQPKKEVRKIQGKNVADLLKDKAKKAEEVKPKENEPIKPETVEIEPQVKSETSQPKEEKPKKERKDLKDLTAFDTYQDYKYAYFWNYKLNKYDADVLEKVAKDYAKEADATRFRSLLTEADFNEKKAEQVKAKEIADIKKAHQEEMAAAEEKRQADVQAAIDKRQAEVDELNEKLTTARSKNRTLTSKLKIDNEALEKIKEAVAPLGIAKIDEIISSAAEKCQGIDDRAAEREKAKEESKPKFESAKDLDIEAETDRIMNAINESVYGPKDETKTETKEVVEAPKEEPKEVEPVLTDTATQEETQKEEPTAETDSDSLVNELSSYDDEAKEVSSTSIFDTAIPNPNVELETVPFTPSWKLGSVENQMADENVKSMGRTR